MNPVSQEVEDVDGARERKVRNYFLCIDALQNHSYTRQAHVLSRSVRKVLYCSSRCPHSQRQRRVDVRAFDADHECFKTGRSRL